MLHSKYEPTNKVSFIILVWEEIAMKRTVILTLVVLSVFIFTGCSSNDQVELPDEKDQIDSIEQPLDDDRDTKKDDTELEISYGTLWEIELEGGMGIFHEDYLSSTMMTEHGLLVRTDREIALIDISSGEIKWRENKGSYYQAWFLWGDDLIYVNKDEDFSLEAMDISSGELLFSVPVGRNSPPLTVYEIEIIGDYIFATGNFYYNEDMNQIYGIHSNSGASVHKLSSGKFISSYMDGYFFRENRVVYTIPSYLMDTSPYILKKRDAITSELLWETEVEAKDLDVSTYYNTFVLDEVVVYNFTDSDDLYRGKVVVLSKDDGEIVFEESGRVIDANKNQALLSQEKKTSLINVNSNEVNWSVDLVGFNGFLSQEKVFLFTKDALVAIDREDGNILWQKEGVLEPLGFQGLMAKDFLERSGLIYAKNGDHLVIIDGDGETIKEYDGRYNIIGRNDKLYLFRNNLLLTIKIETGEEVWSYEGQVDYRSSLRYPSLGYVAVGLDDTLAILDEESGEVVHYLEGYNKAIFSDENRVLLVDSSLEETRLVMVERD